MSVKAIKITAPAALDSAEVQFRQTTEGLAFARGASYKELALTVIPDKNGLKNGYFVSPLIIYVSEHSPSIGISQLLKKTQQFLQENFSNIDVLSISAKAENSQLLLTVLLRAYSEPEHFEKIYDFLEETPNLALTRKSKLIIAPKRTISPAQETLKHTLKEKQERARLGPEPFLNSIDEYIPENDDTYSEDFFDLQSIEAQTKTVLARDSFNRVFEQAMDYITSVERVSYYAVLEGKSDKKNFMNIVSAYLNNSFITKGLLPSEDVGLMTKKIDGALFGFYILQDLIDEPDITDIKITDPDSIRVRIKGKAYLSNVTFLNEEDYIRFIEGLAIKNRISLNFPVQTFTNEQDNNYILRFSLTAPYVTSSGFPILHIRKIQKKKPLAKELIAAGMFDEKIMNYLKDQGRKEGGIVFAGPPGSGKTTILNWFLEDGYESSAEILIIQENDELFAYRRGVMIEHVVNNPIGQEKKCTLEDLGQMALVAGANVFIIGEARGGEICSAITLSNAGCRTAITIHSPSAEKTIDKMADLALRGYADNYEQAKRMLTSFKTIVYLENFRVKEISEVIGYSEEKKDILYKKIYVEGK